MKRNLEALARQQFDLVVIGGGIHGAVTARDAALGGLRVALLEAGDFASGTSSRSTKLIHGGLRYLEHFEFKLVREARQERRLLTELAPHLARPVRFLLPIYRGDSFSPLKIRLGTRPLRCPWESWPGGPSPHVERAAGAPPDAGAAA